MSDRPDRLLLGCVRPVASAGDFVSDRGYGAEVEISFFGFAIETGGSDEELSVVRQSANEFLCARGEGSAPRR